MATQHPRGKIRVWLFAECISTQLQPDSPGVAPRSSTGAVRLCWSEAWPRPGRHVLTTKSSDELVRVFFRREALDDVVLAVTAEAVATRT
jgi:hypothetical protein